MFATRSLQFPALLIVASLLVFAACEEPEESEHRFEPIDDSPAYATVDEVLAAYPEADAAVLIEPVGDGDVHGHVVFQPTEGGLQVTVNLEGLEPGARGFHVHEEGSCEPGPGGEPAGAAGPHFDPHDRPHGAPHDPPEERHAGDFGNVRADSDGSVRHTFVDPVVTLTDETGIVGRGLIVHADRDDLETQPTGDAGDRVGCGIIVARNDATSPDNEVASR